MQHNLFVFLVGFSIGGLFSIIIMIILFRYHIKRLTRLDIKNYRDIRELIADIRIL
jgi:flagellar biogenesis protein FliO